MISRTALLSTLLVIALSATAFGQFTRVNERTWHALRGGIMLGANFSNYSGSVPFRPAADNTFYGNADGTNFLFGVFFEKALSRLIAIGVRMNFDPMSGSAEQNATEIGRISDTQGNLYDVTRDKSVDYILRYFTLGGYAKLYPGGGPGFFLGGGFNASALLRHHYSYENTITSPDWAKGASAPTESGDIDKVNPLRFSIDAEIGYEMFFTSGFVSPQIHYDIGLSDAVDAPWANGWTINNVRVEVAVSFPLP
jgi:hypothetical protein